jgi:hypothetical protein
VQARPNSNAILLTTEITTPAYYKGKDKHRQVTNMIFRTGKHSQDLPAPAAAASVQIMLPACSCQLVKHTGEKQLCRTKAGT